VAWSFCIYLLSYFTYFGVSQLVIFVVTCCIFCHSKTEVETFITYLLTTYHMLVLVVGIMLLLLCLTVAQFKIIIDCYYNIYYY